MILIMIIHKTCRQIFWYSYLKIQLMLNEVLWIPWSLTTHVIIEQTPIVAMYRLNFYILYIESFYLFLRRRRCLWRMCTTTAVLTNAWYINKLVSMWFICWMIKSMYTKIIETENFIQRSMMNSFRIWTNIIKSK